MREKKGGALLTALWFCLILTGCSGRVSIPWETAPESMPPAAGREVELILADAEDTYVMVGPSHTTLLVQFSAGGTEEVQAYALSGGSRTQVPLEPMEFSLDNSAGAFQARFFRCQVGKDSFLFPAEWGSQPFGFAHCSRTEAYLAHTDLGVWRLDAQEGEADKLTSDSYQGIHRARMAQEKQAAGEDLLWVTDVTLSPNGEFAVFRTNRDAEAPGETSLWGVSLDPVAEGQITGPAVYHDILGFIAQDTLLVDGAEHTRIVNVDGGVRAVRLPELSHRRLCAVGSGERLAIAGSEDGKPEETLGIYELTVATGGVTRLTSVSGCGDRQPEFSPSGRMLAVELDPGAERGAEDWLLVDTDTGKQSRISELLPEPVPVRRCCWIDDSRLLVIPGKTTG